MRNRITRVLSLSSTCVILVWSLSAIATAQRSVNYDLGWFAINSGGLRQSANHSIEDSFGQAIADSSISTNARVVGGFVQSVATPTKLSTPIANLPTATPTPIPDSYEDDNSCDLAKEITPNDSRQSHTFHLPSDTDWVSFTPTKGTRYQVEVQIPADSLADVNLEIYGGCSVAASLSWNETFAPGVQLDFEATDSTPILLKITNAQSTTAGENVKYQLSVRKLQATLTEPGAAILVAGRIRVNDKLQPNINEMTGAMYSLLKDAGYTDNKILYLATDTTLKGYDDSATVEHLRDAITTWAIDKLGPDKVLTIYMADHGNPDRFYLDDVNQQSITPDDLNQWLSQLESTIGNGIKINIFIEACYAGSFIEGSSLSHPGRVIVTSANAQFVAYASSRGALFSDHLVTSLRRGEHIFGAYWEAQASVQRSKPLQRPLLDDDGNGIANELDGVEASKRYIFYTGDRPGLDVWPPFIAAITQTTALNNGKATILGEVRDNKAVAKVWALVYPPSYQPPSTSQELVPDLPVIEMIHQTGNSYTLNYDNFTEKGEYRVVINATDTAGLAARPSSITIFTGSNIFLPLVQR